MHGPDTDAPAPSGPGDRGFFGHPRGLAVLFFTELWERFSFYGMRAILILYLTASTAAGGLGFSASKAGALYALYTSMVYLLGLPGGWFADRVVGPRRAVLWGGILIALGHFSLALPRLETFYLGLGFIVMGTGLLKPNISTMVGQLYGPDDARRDAGFSLFYMGINLGAWAGPLVCSLLGERVDWHLGFAAAGVGMVLGLAVYTLGGRTLGAAGLPPADPDARAGRARAGRRAAWVGGGLVLVAGLTWFSGIRPGVETVADSFGVLLLILSLGFFAWLFLAGRWTPEERRRLVAIVVFFAAAAVFWGGYEQAGSSLNLFARDFTDRMLGSFEFPAGWFQQVPAIFCVILAPVFAWLWVRMGPRQPSSPVKFALGLVFLSAGFGVMVLASRAAAAGAQVGPGWLLATYFLHVVGELCLSPVGLSTVTKLAPSRVASLMMGVWFLASAVGNYLGGRTAGFYESLPLWGLFGAVALTALASGLVLLALAPWVRRLMGGVR